MPDTRHNWLRRFAAPTEPSTNTCTNTRDNEHVPEYEHVSPIGQV